MARRMWSKHDLLRFADAEITGEDTMKRMWSLHDLLRLVGAEITDEDEDTMKRMWLRDELIDLLSNLDPIDPEDPDSYEEYALALYDRFGKLTLFENAWQDMKDSETVLFDIPLMLAAPNQDMDGIFVDLYVGTNGQLQALYDACVNETIPPPIDTSYIRDVYYVNNVATFYGGDISENVGFPIPIYMFGLFGPDDSTSFMIVDLTPLEMGLGLVLAKFVNVSIPNNNIVIQQGFEFENENGIIISDSVTSIGSYAFYNWTSNNQPLVIPNSVTSIGDDAFSGWESNNQPLVIPDSVTSIGYTAFSGWSLVPYVEIQAITPPTLADSGAFAFQGNAPIYVPDESVAAYKAATNWVNLASRIFSINDK